MIPNPRRYRSVLVGLAVCCGLALPAQQTKSAAKDDTIKLKNGNVLEGRILKETSEIVTIRVGQGQELAIPKNLIATYTRVSDSGDDNEQKSRWHARNAWFRLKNADGRLVGKLHIYVRSIGPAIQLEQQWTFSDGKSKTLMNRIEKVDHKLRPLSFQYHEIASEAAGNGRRERLVRGEIRHEKLYLEEADSRGRRKRSIPFPEGNYFPMLVEELLRRGEAAGARSFSASVYDPLEGFFELRRYSLADGVPAPTTFRARKTGRARLVESSTGGRTRREWISKEGRILLIEVNGVHLVAEPISEGTAQKLAAFDKEKALPTWREFAGLDVWLPRATWSFGRELVRGKVLDLQTAVPGSEVRAWFLAAGPDEMVLQIAAEDFLKRWALDEPWFKERAREIVQLSGRTCVRVDGGGKDEDGRLRIGRAYVLEAPSGYLVLSAAGPSKSWDFLRLEVEEVVANLRTREQGPQPLGTPAPGK